MNGALDVRDHEDGARVEVRVQPRSSRAAILGVHDGALKVSLTAAPVDGAANQALVELLAEALDLPRKLLRIVRGSHARRKTVHVEGLDAAAVRARLAEACQLVPSAR